MKNNKKHEPRLFYSWLLAIEILIWRYKNDVLPFYCCPLCRVAGDEAKLEKLGRYHCKFCLWTIWGRKEHCMGQLESDYDRRIVRLEKWKKRILEMIERERR